MFLGITTVSKPILYLPHSLALPNMICLKKKNQNEVDRSVNNVLLKEK